MNTHRKTRKTKSFNFKILILIALFINQYFFYNQNTSRIQSESNRALTETEHSESTNKLFTPLPRLIPYEQGLIHLELLSERLPSMLPSIFEHFNIHLPTPQSVTSDDLDIPKNILLTFQNLAEAYKTKTHKPPHIFFACTGNTCRSAAAEELLRRFYKDTMIITSGGTNVRLANSSMTPAVEGVIQGTQLGIENSNREIKHKSRPIMSENEILPNILEADIIIVMEQKHKDYILAQIPGILKPIIVLGVDDPFLPPAEVATRSVSSQHGSNFVMVKNVILKIHPIILNFFIETLGIDVFLRIIKDNKLKMGGKIAKNKTRLTRKYKKRLNMHRYDSK